MADLEKGLSLENVFDGVETPAVEEKTALEEPDKKEGEEKVDEKKEEKSEGNDSSPDEKKEEEKSKDDSDKKEGEEKDPPDKKAGEEEGEGKKKEEINWESEDNPFHKRFKDTQTWANKSHQEKLQLQDQLSSLTNEVAILRKKADGTWSEEDEKKNAVTPEEVATSALNVGKALASKNAAYREQGQEKVDADLAEFTELFENDPIIQADVLANESPVLRALDVMSRYRFEKKHGPDPKSIYASIEKEVTEKLEKGLRKQITQEILEGKKKKDKNPDGLSSTRGSSGIEEKSPTGKAEEGHQSLDTIFAQ